MTKFLLSFINDEVSNNLDGALSFALENKLNYIELRTLNGFNLVDLEKKQIEEIKNVLNDHNISVSAIASPLFKWYFKPQSQTNAKIDTFSFQPNLNVDQKKEYIDKAIEYAQLLETSYIRVFSLLQSYNEKAETFYERERDLYVYLEKQLKGTGIKILLENEPVCNFYKSEHLNHFKELFPFNNGRLLLDVGNLYYAGEKFLPEDIGKVSEFVEYVHIKDFDITEKKYVTVGEGIIPYKEFFLEFSRLPLERLFISLETHSEKDKFFDSMNSIKNISNLINFI